MIVPPVCVSLERQQCDLTPISSDSVGQRKLTVVMTEYIDNIAVLKRTAPRGDWIGQRFLCSFCYSVNAVFAESGVAGSSTYRHRL